MMNFYGSIEGKTILDIGCYTGYYCFLFASKGAKVVGIEEVSEWANTAEAFRKEKGLDVEIVNSKIENYINNCPLHFDLTLFLNVFHYLLFKNPEKAWEVMRKISEKTEAMFLMLKIKKGDLAGEFVERNKPNFPEGFPEEQIFPQMVIENTWFTNYRRVIKDSVYKKRDLWFFYKKDKKYGEMK